jgi:hypothetical protein
VALKKIPEKACVQAHKLRKLNQYRDEGSTKRVAHGQREVSTGRERAPPQRMSRQVDEAANEKRRHR